METETFGGETATEKRQRSSRHGRGIHSAMRCAVNAAATQEQQWREWRRLTARWQGRSFWGGCKWEKEGRPAAVASCSTDGCLWKVGKAGKRKRKNTLLLQTRRLRPITTAACRDGQRHVCLQRARATRSLCGCGYQSCGYWRYHQPPHNDKLSIHPNPARPLLAEQVPTC